MLIVDDNQQDSALLKKLLKRRFDAEVFEACSMREADMIVSANNLDCIVLDLQLPDSDIEKTIDHIRELPYPVFVYSGFDDPILRERVLNSGAEDFILKATGNASIIERIGHLQYKRKPDPKLLQGAYQARHDEPARMARSEWKATIPRVAAAIVTVLAFASGALMGAWNAAKSKGREDEEVRQHFERLDMAITEIGHSNNQRDILIRDLSDKATQSRGEQQAIRDQMNMKFDSITDWLKRIENKMDNIYLFQPQAPNNPKTTRR